MKKIIFLFVIASLSIWSCEDKEQIDANAITLLTPADGAHLDLASVNEVVFEWSDVERIMIYRLLLGRSSDLSDAAAIPLMSSPQVFPAKKIDAALAELGVAEGQEAALYWSVTPAIDDATVATQVRAITLVRSVRPAIELTAPGATVDGRQPSTFPAVFAWTQTPGVDNYVIKFAIDETFPEVSTWKRTFTPDDELSALTVTTADEWDALLEKAGVPLNGQATVYWTVEPETPNNEVVSLVRSFTGIRPLYPTVYLTAPADNSVQNANSMSFPIAFTWESGSVNIPAYTLKFSTNPEFPAGTATQTIAKGSALTHSLNDDAYDQLLASLGIALYEQQTVYWTVTPTTPQNKEVTFTYSFTAVRKTALKTPVAGGSVELDYKALDTKVRFEWDAVGTGPYELVVSTDPNGNNVIYSQPGISSTSAEYTHRDFQTLIENLSLKRYKANTLYWNIKAGGGALISETPSPFKLYGIRIFVDKRAENLRNTYPDDYAADPTAAGFVEPEQTYRVVVLQYNGKEVVWLAEDLRATAGWQNPYLEFKIQPPMPMVTYYGVDIPAKYYNRTEPPQGVYYDEGWLNEIVPEGWKMPSLNEWEEMFNAALATYGGEFGDNVVRHPDFYTGSKPEHLNEWGMNFVSAGQYNYCTAGFIASAFFWNDQSLYYQYGENKDRDIRWDGYTLTDLNCSNGSLCRAIYTGDDE